MHSTYLLLYVPALCFSAYYSLLISAKDKMCRPATWIEVEDRNKNTHAYTHAHTHARTGNERKRRGEGESALLPLWICRFATTVSVTFAKVRNKTCVCACVCLCVLDVLGCECAQCVQCVPWPTLIRSVLLSAVVATGCETMLVSFSPAFHQYVLPHHVIFVLV